MADKLIALDSDILDVVADTFRLRLLNHSREKGGDAWETILVTLIPKVRLPKCIKQCRPFAIPLVLCKLYSKLLDWLLSGTGVNMKRTEEPQFAFKPGHKCHEIIFMLRNIFESSVE